MGPLLTERFTISEARASVELDVVGLGECSLDEVWVVPSLLPGEKLRATQREQLGGGQVATAMVAAARLGLRAAYLGAVGDDAAGRQVLDELREESVDARHVRVVTGGATRSALILVDAAGERTVIEHPGAVLRPDEIAESGGGAVIARARVLHLDATQIATSLAAARIARAHGVVVSLDLDHARPGLDELLELVDVCVTSESVPQQLTGERDLEQAMRKLAALTGPFVACTLGARGAAALDDGHLLLSPPFAVEVVDTTACGDTFHAAVIAALLDGRTVGETLRFANAAAALKCRALGRRGCPARSEVNALLARA